MTSRQHRLLCLFILQPLWPTNRPLALQVSHPARPDYPPLTVPLSHPLLEPALTSQTQCGFTYSRNDSTHCPTPTLRE